MSRLEREKGERVDERERLMVVLFGFDLEGSSTLDFTLGLPRMVASLLLVNRVMSTSRGRRKTRRVFVFFVFFRVVFPFLSRTSSPPQIP